MKKLLVFLGNPSAIYKNTRHNAGWQICDCFPGLGSWQKKFHGSYQKVGESIFLKPETFMNESGVSVREAATFFQIAPKDIIVFHDDTELEFGEIRFQKGGGLKGHNGLKSIRQNLSSDEFSRLRFGIGRPAHGDLASFVLGHFSEIEKAMLGDLLKQAVLIAGQNIGIQPALW